MKSAHALADQSTATPGKTVRADVRTPRATARSTVRPAVAPVAANRVAAGPIPAPRTLVSLPVPASLRARLAPIVGGRAVEAARIHIGPGAHAHALKHKARAVAEGDHVFFADGEYRPGTRAGDALIAHELAHVDQAQRGVLRGPARKAMGSAEHSALEAAADKAGDDLAAGADLEKHKRPKRERGRKKGGAGTATGATAPTGVAGAGAAPGTAAATGTAKGTTVAAEGPAGTTPQIGAAEGAKAARVPGEVPPELPRMPEAATELSTKERGRINTVEKRAGGHAKATATAPTADQNVTGAKLAVAKPQQERDARAAEEVATALLERQPPSPEIVALCERIKTLIAEKRPPDEDAVVDSRSDEVAQEAGGEVAGDVKKNVDDANASYAAINETPTGPAAPEPPGIEPIPDPAAAPPVGATVATPDPVPAEQVNLDSDSAEMDAKAKDAGMEEETAQLVQSGPVADARSARGELNALGKDGPGEALKQQQAALGQANADMAALQTQALAALKHTRKGHAAGVGKQQEDFKGGEEALRLSLADKATKIFTDAQTVVQGLLKPVPEAAMKKWTTGLPFISTRFNDELKVVKAKIDERHSGVTGFFVSGWDAVTGLPGWVNRAYDAAEKHFGDDVCALITEISADVNTVIKACDILIEDARTQIRAVFTTDLPAGLETWAAEQTKLFDKKLDQLHDSAEATRSKFNKELIENAGGAVQAARERIHKLRQEAKGLWGRFLDAVGKFLDDPLKFIIDGLLELVGISPKAFWNLVDKIAEVISDIAWHPVRFITNLMDGVGAGIDLFLKHFATHLRKGFFDWLFSGLKDLGVEVPADFSLKSIITFFLQLMGISWVRIRKLLAEEIGEKYVAAAEKVLKLGELIAKGPQGIIDFIKDKLSPESLLERILKMAIEYVVETLVVQVGLYIIKLLNPVGAVLAAIETIYKVLKWIFHNAARIFHFIEAVVNALGAVVAGDISAVAKGVETGLSMLIPPVVDLFAELISLGDLPEQVAKIVKSLQTWVEGIIRSIIKFLAETAKSLLASMGIGGKDGEKGKEGATGAIGQRLTFTSGKETHHLYIDVANKAATVMVSSTPMTLASWLDGLDRKEIPALADKEQQKKASGLVASARKQLAATDADADKAAAASAPTGEAGAAPAPSPELAQKVNAEEAALRDTLEQLGAMFGKPTIAKSLVIKGAAKVTDYADALVTSIESTASGTDLHKETTGPDFIHSLLEARKGEASFDDASGALSLGAPGASTLGAANSAKEMGDVAAAATGVARINFTKGQADFTLVGAIDEVRAKLAFGDAPRFKPVVKDVLADNIQIKAADPGLVIVDREGVQVSERFVASRQAVFADNEVLAGQELHAKSQKAFTTEGQPIERIVSKGWLAATDRKLIADGAPKVFAILTDFGTGLDITTLKRATEREKTQLDTVIFNMTVPPAVVGNAAYEKNFQDEVTRQLGEQEAGQNRLSVDAWVVNVATYKAPNQSWIASLGSATRRAVLEEIESRIKEAGAEALRQTNELKNAQKTVAKIHTQVESNHLTVEQAIAKITSDSYIRNQFTGRYGNEVEWRAEHTEAIGELLLKLEPLWAGLESRSAGYIKNAITHNADQVGGGEGKLPDITKVPKPKPGEDDTAWQAYLDEIEPYIGASKVNSRIGPGWGANIEDIFSKVTTRHKKEASYPLWLMNFKLDVKYG